MIFIILSPSYKYVGMQHNHMSLKENTMATLVSPGVSVTVTDESFYIPAAAPTVPLIFVATADDKNQPDGVSPAGGTFEHNVIRTVTSISQSVNLFGVPRFLKDVQENPQHGDVRNEYGLFALNQFLGVGNKAYVIRANVNLNDSRGNILTLWDRSVNTASLVLEQLISLRIQEYNESNHLIPSSNGIITTINNLVPGSGYTDGVFHNQALTPVSGPGVGVGALADITVVGGKVTAVAMMDRGTGYSSADVLTAALPVGSGFTIAVHTIASYKTTVTQSEFLSDTTEAMQMVYDKYSFRNLEPLFQVNHDMSICDGATGGFCVYANGYALLATDQFPGLTGLAMEWVAAAAGQTAGSETEWSVYEASAFLIEAADNFKFTVEFLNATSLGANDAARRVAVVQALQAAINSNQEIRSDTYEFNLILCPGFHETIDELLALATDINEEAFVIADTPMNMDPDALVSAWGDSTTSTRQHSNNVAYYYPHGLASNLDGSDVMIAASGIALRTYAYSDNVSQIWFAPAGSNRGVVTGVAQVGFAKGTMGSATTFVPTSLTQGQRDNMYKFFTNINPISNLPGRGILVFGQKTSQNSASAMDRVNVSRLVKYIKRQLRKNVVPFLFEPNDQLTRNNVKATVDGFLQDIMVKRGLYDFVTLCDESNNTPDRIDRNELYIDVALKPVKAIEFIYIPIRIVATGAQI
jgi:hypothetical protein